jgi:hypothetical protein
MQVFRLRFISDVWGRVVASAGFPLLRGGLVKLSRSDVVESSEDNIAEFVCDVFRPSLCDTCSESTTELTNSLLLSRDAGVWSDTNCWGSPLLDGDGEKDPGERCGGLLLFD